MVGNVAGGNGDDSFITAFYEIRDDSIQTGQQAHWSGHADLFHAQPW